MASFLDLTERPHQCLHLHMSKRDVLCAVFEGCRMHTEGEAGKPQLGQKAGRPGQQRAREEPGAGGASPRSRHHEAARARRQSPFLLRQRAAGNAEADDSANASAPGICRLPGMAEAPTFAGAASCVVLKRPAVVVRSRRVWL